MVDSTFSNYQKNKKRKPDYDFFHSWLTTSSPPNSYMIEIGYVDTIEKRRQGVYSSDDDYAIDEIRWLDMPFRFTNYAQAKVFGMKNYTPILFRIAGSSDDPNYFKYDSYSS